MPKKIPVYQVVFDPNDEENELEFISLVSEPAIQVNYLKFKKQQEKLKFSYDQDRQIVTGPVLIPNQLVYRKVGQKEFFVKFDAETIASIMQHSIKKGVFLANLEHDGKAIEGVYFTENWIKTTEQDKSNALGFDLPVGTAFASAHIEDKALWKKIKDGKLNGFSIEGRFFLEKTNEKMSLKKMMEERLKLEAELKKLNFGTLSDGSQIFKDADGVYYVAPEAGTEGEIIIAPDGEHEVTSADGETFTLTISDGMEESIEKDDEGTEGGDMEMMEKENKELKEANEVAMSKIKKLEQELLKLKSENEAKEKQNLELSKQNTLLSTSLEKLSLAIKPKDGNKPDEGANKNKKASSVSSARRYA